MPDPVSNAEIEDVLSSIRRLVSEEPHGARRKSGLAHSATDRLVLTPDQRIANATADADAAPVTERRGTASDAWKPDPDDTPDLGGIATLTPQGNATRDEEAGTLEDRVAGLEAALLQAGGDWEPDGSEDGSTDLTRPISADAGFDMAEAWQRDTGTDEADGSEGRAAEPDGAGGATSSAASDDAKAAVEDTAAPSGMPRETTDTSTAQEEPVSDNPLAGLDEDTDLSELLYGALGPVAAADAENDTSDTDKATPDTARAWDADASDASDRAAPVPAEGETATGAPDPGVAPLRLETPEDRARARRLPGLMAVDLSAVDAILSEVAALAPPAPQPEDPSQARAASEDPSGPDAEAEDPQETDVLAEAPGEAGASPGAETGPEDEDVYTALAARMASSAANTAGPVTRDDADAPKPDTGGDALRAGDHGPTEPQEDTAPPEPPIADLDLTALERALEAGERPADHAAGADPDLAGAEIEDALRTDAADRTVADEAERPETTPEPAAPGIETTGLFSDTAAGAAPGPDAETVAMPEDPADTSAPVDIEETDVLSAGASADRSADRDAEQVQALEDTPADAAAGHDDIPDGATGTADPDTDAPEAGAGAEILTLGATRHSGGAAVEAPDGSGPGDPAGRDISTADDALAAILDQAADAEGASTCTSEAPDVPVAA